MRLLPLSRLALTPSAAILESVADLSFSQPARRNLLLPIVLALAVLAAAVFGVLRYTPHSTADVSVTHSAVFPSHIVFKSNSIVLNSDQAQDDLYILVTVRITNHLRLPLFLKDFNASLIPSAETGGLPLTTSAVEKPDLVNLYTSFPGLKRLADTQTAPPLFRDTKIEPGQTTEGYLVLHFSGPQSVWDRRQNASLSIDLYHQASLTVDIPNTTPAQP